MDVHKPVIVAGVSELAGGDVALAAAAALARRTGGELHLVHAYDLPRVFNLAPGLSTAFPEGAETYRGSLEDRLQAAAREAGAEGCRLHVPAGSPARTLLRVARHVRADLIVVGAARGARLAQLFLGTTAQRVLRGAEVPVLVLHGPLGASVERLLMTSDLSETSAAVHDAGLCTVEALFGRPAAVRSLFVMPWAIVPSPVPQGALEETVLRQVEAFLHDRADRRYPVAAKVRVGEPAREIVGEAREWNADLVVVGTHARGPAARLLLGSVAEATLRDAPCNALAVPPCHAAVGETEPDTPAMESPNLAAYFDEVAVP